MSFSDGIPWVIAVLGWGATHVFSEARERRKEYRSQIDKLHERLLKIEEDACAFHCAELYDENKADDFLRKLNLLERLIISGGRTSAPVARWRLDGRDSVNRNR